MLYKFLVFACSFLALHVPDLYGYPCCFSYSKEQYEDIDEDVNCDVPSAPQELQEIHDDKENDYGQQSVNDTDDQESHNEHSAPILQQEKITIGRYKIDLNAICYDYCSEYYLAKEGVSIWNGDGTKRPVITLQEFMGRIGSDSNGKRVIVCWNGEYVKIEKNQNDALELDDRPVTGYDDEWMNDFESTLRQGERDVCIILPANSQVKFLVDGLGNSRINIGGGGLDDIPRYDENTPQTGGWAFYDDFKLGKYSQPAIIIDKTNYKRGKVVWAIYDPYCKKVFGAEAKLSTQQTFDGIIIDDKYIADGYAKKILPGLDVEEDCSKVPGIYKNKFVWTVRIDSDYFIKNKDENGPLLARTEADIDYIDGDDSFREKIMSGFYNSKAVFFDDEAEITGSFASSCEPDVQINLKQICYPMEGDAALLKNQILAIWNLDLSRKSGISLRQFLSSQQDKALIKVNSEYVAAIPDGNGGVSLHKVDLNSYYATLYSNGLDCGFTKDGQTVYMVLQDNFTGEIVFPDNEKLAQVESGDIDLGYGPKYNEGSGLGWITGEEFLSKYPDKKVLALYKKEVPHVCIYDENTGKVLHMKLKSKITFGSFCFEESTSRIPAMPGLMMRPQQVTQFQSKFIDYNGKKAFGMLTKTAYDSESKTSKHTYHFYSKNPDGRLFAATKEDIKYKN